MPSRNTRRLTLACLAALDAAARARPELAGLEVILVDDAGDDGTAEAVAGLHPAVRVLRLEAQAGFTRAANAGLAAAAGDVLLLLNSDTEVDAAGEGLAALLAAFAADPRQGILGAALHYPDGSAQWSGGGEPRPLWLLGLASGLPALLGRLPLYRRLRPPSGTPAAGAGGDNGGDGGGGGDSGGGIDGIDGIDGTDGGGGIVGVDWVTGAALAIRRAAWERVGPLDERFRFYAQDLDLCVRARAAGWAVAVLAEFRVLHHHGATIGSAGGTPSTGGANPRGAGEIEAATRGTSRVRSGGHAVRSARGGAQHAELLWTDLLRWAAKHGGEREARRAARALRVGAALRLLGRRGILPLLAAADRPRFAADTAAFARALAAVQRLRRANRAGARGGGGGSVEGAEGASGETW